MRKIIEADILSENYDRLKITLSNGEVIEGKVFGIIHAFDEEGEELGYDLLAFKADKPAGVRYSLRDEDILKVEGAT